MSKETRAFIERFVDEMGLMIVDDDPYGRDYYKCRACERMTPKALPNHPGHCNVLCMGGHVQEEINHADDCMLKEAKRLLKLMNEEEQHANGS